MKDNLETKYSCFEDGKLIEVPTMEDCFNAIRIRYENVIEQNRHLQEENKKLKSEHYESEEIQRLSKELQNAREDLYRGFSITEEEHRNIRDWMKEHDEKVHKLDTLEKKMRAGGAIGGRYSYHFIPTSIGVIGTVRCTCGEEFTFCEI